MIGYVDLVSRSVEPGIGCPNHFGTFAGGHICV